MGTYVYAILPGEQRLALGRLGLPDGKAPVTMLPRSGLAALVSEYRGPAVATLPKDDLLRLLTLHQQVIERAMDNRPVLPVKFGTVLASRRAVGVLLEQWQRPLLAAFGQLGDAVEVEVAATWDLPQTFAEIGRQPEVAALVAQVAGQPPAEQVAARVQVGRLVKDALDRRREAYCAKAVHELAPWTVDRQPNLLASDELVFNMAFLVERTRLDGFFAQVHRFDAALEGRLAFRCIGPLPPYSFATVELTRLRPEDIEAARRFLELEDRASEAEVNASYRRLAARYHPDHHADDPAAPGRFAALAAARARLLAYLRSQQAGADPDSGERQYDLRRRTAAEVILMTIKRSQPEPQFGTEASHERNPVTV